MSDRRRWPVAAVALSVVTRVEGGVMRLEVANVLTWQRDG